jgi:hypothetical protein
MSWTVAMLCNVLSFASFFIFETFSVFIVSVTWLSANMIPLKARADSLTSTSSRRVSPAVFERLQWFTSRWMENLAYTPKPHGMIVNRLHATLGRSAYFEYVFSWWRHYSVMSGIKNVLLISIHLEW